MNFFSKAAAIVTLTIASGTALAAPITGNVQFSGLNTLSPPNTLTATFIDFDGAIVNFGVGSYAGLAFGDPATFVDWQFSPAVAQTLWTVVKAGTTYSYAISSVTNLVRLADSLVIDGLGTLTISGVLNYSPTQGTFHYSTQDNGGNTATNVSFSANDYAVPEPSTLALLGGSSKVKVCLLVTKLTNSCRLTSPASSRSNPRPMRVLMFG